MKDGWEVRPLGEVAMQLRGNAALEPQTTYELWSVPSFSDGAPEVVLGSDVGSAKQPVAADDVLLCKINPRINRVWRVGPQNGLVKVASLEWIALRVLDEAGLNPEFLQLFLSAPDFREWIEGEVTGATGSHTRAKPKEVLKQPIPLPPLEEQRRIVAVLDEAFEGLARACANIEANLADAENVLAAMLRDALANVSDAPTKRLADVAENLDRLRVPITKRDRKPGPIPYYGASGMVDQVADFIFDEDLLLVSEDGANLLARTYPIAFSISGKSWVNNHAHVLRFETMTAQRYVEIYLNSISLEPYVTGMAQPKLNQKALNGIPIPVPSESQMQEIVAVRRDGLEKTAALSDAYTAQLADLDALRQSLLARAFRGELT